MDELELQAFLDEHQLVPCEGVAPLSVRAAKLKQAIDSNPELIDPSRTPGERQ